jgi:hypothetical protein
MDYPKLADQLPQVPGGTENICLRIVSVGHTQVFCRAWHKLAQPNGASVTDR